MKKIYLYILFMAIAFASCNKFEEAPVDTTDERLNETLDSYSAILANAPHGWKGYLLTKTEVPVTLYFNFDGKNRVTMAAEWDEELNTSSYLVKALQRPSLLFDTYSSLHELADPTSSVLGGATGLGYSSDFEFAFTDVKSDTIVMEGLLNKSKLLLIKSKSEQETEEIFDAVAKVGAAVGNLKKYFKRTTINGVECEVKFDANSRVISIGYLEGDKMITQKSIFYVSNNEIYLYNDLKVKDEIIRVLKNVRFDASAKAVKADVNGKEIAIADNLKPLRYDPLAARKWHTQMAANFNGCWVSDDAFHANGVDDFCQFGLVPGYQNLWYAGPSVFGGDNEALITFTGALGAPYALGANTANPFPIVDGLARFTLRGSTTGFVNTTAVGRAMTAARQILFGGATNGSSQDWYLIQTADDGRRYDMVRVSDAEAWISWRPR